MDAFKLIQAIIDAEIDCLILLDAYIPDRFHDMWRPTTSNVEILAKGETVEMANGKKMENDPGDFSYQIVKTLDAFVKEIDGRKCVKCGTVEKRYERGCGEPIQKCDVPDCKGRLVKCGFAGYQAALSLPELLIKHDTFIRNSKEISGRIRRIDIHRGKAEKRFVILPGKVRKTGKIEFVAKCKVEPEEATPGQEEVEAVKANDGPQREGTVFMDEGLADMEQDRASALFCSPAPEAQGGN